MATVDPGGGGSGPARGAVDRTRVPRFVVVLFAIVWIAYGLSPVVTNGDSFLVVPTAHSLLADGDVDLREYPPPATAGGIAHVREGSVGREVNGGQLPASLPSTARVYDYFPWLTAVLAVPLVALFEIPGLLGHDALDVDTLIASGETGLLNLVGGATMTATAVALLALTVWRLLELPEPARRRAAVTVGMVTALGTSAWSTLSRALWNQSTAVLMISCTLLLTSSVLVRHRQGVPSDVRHVLLLGTAAGASVAARPTSALLLVGLGLWLVVAERRRVVAYAVGAASVLVVWALVNAALYGQLVAPYYAGDRARLSDETLVNIAENLVSPNRGLLTFTPVVLVSVVGLVLGLRRRGPLTPVYAATLSLVALGHLLAVSGSGLFSGASYGPRYLADLLPLLVVLATPAVQHLFGSGRPSHRAAAVALAVAAVVLHAPGALSKPAQCWNAVPTDISLDQGRVWDWSDPQALRGVRALRETGSLRSALLQRCDAAVLRARQAGA